MRDILIYDASGRVLMIIEHHIDLQHHFQWLNNIVACLIIRHYYCSVRFSPLESEVLEESEKYSYSTEF